MINRKTWLLKDKPDSYPPPYQGRTRHHEAAKSWGEVTPGNQVMFMSDVSKILNLARELNLKSRLEMKFFAFGSRVNGFFTENSDVDIGITGLSKEDHHSLKSEFNGTGIDIKVFSDHIFGGIEIPLSRLSEISNKSEE